MYRPTIRCSDVYKEYLDQLSDVTGLDRNQIIRLALFSAPFSNLFIAQIREKTGDVNTNTPLPHPSWEAFDHHLWMEQDPKFEKREEEVKNNEGVTSHVESRGEKETENAIGDPEPRRESTTGKENEQYRRQQSETGRTREIFTEQRRVIRSGGGITIKINQTSKSKRDLRDV